MRKRQSNIPHHFEDSLADGTVPESCKTGHGSRAPLSLALIPALGSYSEGAINGLLPHHRQQALHLCEPARTAGQGHALAQRRRAGRCSRGLGRGASGRAVCPGRSAAGALFHPSRWCPTKTTKSRGSSWTRTTPRPLRPCARSPWASCATGCSRDEATAERIAALAPGLTPEMAAAVSKLMRVQDLIAAARKDPRGHALSHHGWTAGKAERAACSPTTPLTIARGHCRGDSRWAAARLRRRGHRHQSRRRQR